jgi:hypothetical protein
VGGGEGGEMTQTIYAHVNKRIIKEKKFARNTFYNAYWKNNDSKENDYVSKQRKCKLSF